MRIVFTPKYSEASFYCSRGKKCLEVSKWKEKIGFEFFCYYYYCYCFNTFKEIKLIDVFKEINLKDKRYLQ